MMRILLCLAMVLLAPLASPAALAHDYVIGDLKIDHPWARPTTSTRQPGGGFFAIENTGEVDQRLLEVRAEGFAEAIEIHTIIEEDGIFRMRRMPDGLVIPAGETVTLEPGGMHLMMFGLVEPLAEGMTPSITLVFEELGELSVNLTVEYPALEEPADAGHDH
jgi:copper(I)-binding protein